MANLIEKLKELINRSNENAQQDLNLIQNPEVGAQGVSAINMMPILHRAAAQLDLRNPVSSRLPEQLPTTQGIKLLEGMFLGNVDQNQRAIRAYNQLKQGQQADPTDLQALNRASTENMINFAGMTAPVTQSKHRTYADMFDVDPNKEVTVYRGVKKSDGDEIVSGNWVTQNDYDAKVYAKERGKTEGWKILKKKVKARELKLDPSTNPGVENEFRYTPQAKQPPLSDLRRYEAAFNKKDMAVLDELSQKYPGDTHFQVHKSVYTPKPEVKGAQTLSVPKNRKVQIQSTTLPDPKEFKPDVRELALRRMKSMKEQPGLYDNPRLTLQQYLARYPKDPEIKKAMLEVSEELFKLGL